jgi:hypothetical protein
VSAASLTLAGVRPRSSSRAPRRSLQWLFGAFVVAVVIAPMVLTGSTFGGDWPGHLWLVDMQARNIEYLGHPSLFVQSTFGAFEPWYAFYGGTLYSLVAAVAVVIGGHVLVAYIASFAAAAAMAYGGFTWLAKQAGVPGWWAHVCGLMFVTSAYYLADVYARGAWPETVATSALPLLTAAAVWLLRSERWRLGPTAAFVVSAILFTGSHNITLLLGSVFLVLLVLAVLVAFGRSAMPPRRRVLELVGLALLSAAVNLWFLLPDVAYEGHTVIGQSFNHPPAIKGGTPPVLILDPIRHSRVRGYPTFDMQLPTLALLWAAATMAVCWRALSSAWRRMAAGLVVISLPFLALLFIPALWHAVPHLFWAIQFPYRLVTYATYCAVGLVMIALLALTRTARSRASTALVAAGVLIVAVEVGQSINEQWGTPSSLSSRAEALPGANKLPSFWDRFATYLEFQDSSMPVRSATIPEVPGLTYYNGQEANVVPLPVTVPKGSYSITFTPPKSGTLNTEVVTGPYLVAVHGARFVGRTPYSDMLIEVQKPASGPITVTFGTAHTRPILLGRWATFLSILCLLALIAWLGVRDFRARAPAGRSAASPQRPPPS